MKINLLIQALASLNLTTNELQPSTRKCENTRTKRSKIKKHKRICNPQRLPTPKVFYQNLGIELKGLGEWRVAKCPFHDDKRPSLSINILHGGYKCHACGVSGDMIKFYTSYKCLDFFTACDELDLWEERK